MSDEEPRNVKELLVEAKDGSERMVDVNRVNHLFDHTAKTDADEPPNDEDDYRND